MNNKNFHFLIKVANLLEKDIDTCGLANQIENLLKEIAPVKALSLYVFDSVTGTIRNCVADWSVIEDESEIYNIFDKIKGEDFIINSKAFKLPSVIGEITFGIKSLYIPILKSGSESGVIEIEFEEESCIDTEFLFMMKIFGSQISLKLQNIVLNEQSKINVDFHDSMKNIAKIIETQYELNYIVPLIGEMLDRFISDHLMFS